MNHELTDTNFVDPASDKPFAFNRATYGEVIRKFRLKRGMTQPQLAKVLNTHKNYVSNWEMGKARPDLNIVPELCDALGMTLEDFFARPSYSEEDLAMLRQYHSLSASNRAAVGALIARLLDIEAESMREYCKTHFIPLRREEQKMSAGYGNPLSDRAESTSVYVRSTALTERADTIITVWGDSMEPRFHDGDEALVRFCTAIEPGEIGVFVADGESYIKQYQPDGLHSLNPKYPVRVFYEDDDTHLVGRVIGVLSEADYPTEAERKVLEEMRRS